MPVIEKTDPYDKKSYAAHFAVAVLILVASTVWAMWDEIYTRRPWKDYQKDFITQAQGKLQKDLENAEMQLEQSPDYQAIKKKLAQAAQEFTASSRRQEIALEIDEIDDQMDTLRKKLIVDRGKYQALVYEMERTEEKTQLQAAIAKLEPLLDQNMEEMDRLKERKKLLRQELKELRGEKEELEKALSELEEPVHEIRRRLESLLSEKIHIRQRVNPDIHLVDRCESCHLGTCKSGLSDLPAPYQSHPEVFTITDYETETIQNILDIHQVEKYGCTTCHRGQGYATTSVEKGHGDVEYWLTPRLEGDTVQGACLKCHDQEPYLQGAPVLNQARILVSDLGCFACHNFGVLTPEEKSHQIGYDLTDVGSKLIPAWMVSWIENPRKYRSDSMMPDFRFSRSEALDIASYLWQNSRSERERSTVIPFNKADVEPGKQLFESRACMGCHRIGEKGNTYAPNLSRIGEKTHYEYLANWILHPRIYQPGSEMPNLNLTPEEAAKIAVFLSLQRREGGSYPPVDLDDPNLLATGQNLISDYNCYGCHNIPGFEGKKELTPELYNIGTKPIERFDFGLIEESILHSAGMKNIRENVSRARELWIRNKLQDPRCYDQGKYLKPQEHLRMPDYALTSEQINALTTLLLGLTGEKLPPNYLRIPTRLERAISRGRTYFRIFRCFACHGDEGVGGIINPNYTKETIPALNTLAEKLQLEEQEDTEKIMQLIVDGYDLRTFTQAPPVPRFPLVQAQYDGLFDLILQGKIVGKKDLAGLMPPFHMPSWGETLSSLQINDIVVYLLSQYPWDEDEDY